MPYTYQPGEIEQIEQRYQAGATLEQLAQDYNKSVASVRMKLVKRGTYVKQTTTKTTTTQPTAKAQPTTKGEVLLAYKQALGWVGAAPF